MSRNLIHLALGTGLSVALATTAFAAKAGVLDTYKKQAKAAGYEPLYPATDGVKPGIVYFMNGTSQQTICAALFKTPNPPPNDVTLNSIKAEKTSEVSAGLSLAPDAVKKVAEASVDLKASGVTKGTVAFAKPQTEETPAQIDEKGDKREYMKACAEQLATFFNPESGKPTRDIYVITGTLSVAGITYDVNVAKNKEAGLKAVLEKLFTLKFGYKKTSDTTAQLNFQPADAADRRVIGVKRVKLTSVKFDTIVSDAANGVVKGEIVPASETSIQLSK